MNKEKVKKELKKMLINFIVGLIGFIIIAIASVWAFNKFIKITEDTVYDIANGVTATETTTESK